jgi:hypothetical protein
LPQEILLVLFEKDVEVLLNIETRCEDLITRHDIGIEDCFRTFVKL